MSTDPITAANLTDAIVISNAVGNLASVLGVVISLVGFAFTIWNVRRSKTAAEAAKSAADDARASMRNIDLVSDFSAAITMLEEIKNLHRTSSLHFLPDKYSKLRKTLIGLKHDSPNLTEEHRSILQNAITHLSDLESRIERALETDSKLDGFAKINEVLSRQADGIYEMLLDLRTEVGS